MTGMQGASLFFIPRTALAVGIRQNVMISLPL